MVLAGVPKAGTSALARWLGDRPDVLLPPDKEVHYFDEHPEMGLDWFRAHFPVDADRPVAIDATPTYALRDDWFAHLAATLPDARIILLLRHPVDRLWSAYWYLRSMGLERRSIEQAVDEGLRRTTELHPHVAIGEYPAMLDRVAHHYPDHQVLVLLHDDLRTSPEAVFDQTCAFLDLPRCEEPASVGRSVNVTGTIRSFRLRYWTLRLHLFRRIPRLAHALDDWNRTTDRPPLLPDPIRQRLLAHYEPHIAEVERRLGRDLTDWRR